MYGCVSGFCVVSSCFFYIYVGFGEFFVRGCLAMW